MLNSIRNVKFKNAKDHNVCNRSLYFIFVTMLTNTPHAAGGKSCGTTNPILGPKKRDWDKYKQRTPLFVFFWAFPALQHVVFVPPI